MKVSFTRSSTSTARKMLSGLREKLFERDDRTDHCHSKSLTAMKRWIPFVLVPVAEFLLVDSATRRFLMATGRLPFARKIRFELSACNGFSRCAALYTKSKSITGEMKHPGKQKKKRKKKKKRHKKRNLLEKKKYTYTTNIESSQDLQVVSLFKSSWMWTTSCK